MKIQLSSLWTCSKSSQPKCFMSLPRCFCYPLQSNKQLPKPCVLKQHLLSHSFYGSGIWARLTGFSGSRSLTTWQSRCHPGPQSFQDLNRHRNASKLNCGAVGRPQMIDLKCVLKIFWRRRKGIYWLSTNARNYSIYFAYISSNNPFKNQWGKNYPIT